MIRERTSFLRFTYIDLFYLAMTNNGTLWTGLLENTTCHPVVPGSTSKFYDSSDKVSNRYFTNPRRFSLHFLTLPSSYSPISPLIPSAQLTLGLPRFLLPGGRHFITSFGNLPSSTLWTCPYHWSCFVLISSERDIVTFNTFIYTEPKSLLYFNTEKTQKWQSKQYCLHIVCVCVCVYIYIYD